jgi:hypothetical protein
MPDATSWCRYRSFRHGSAFNVWLEEQCRKRQRDRLRGESETIGERLQRDLAAMRMLPASPFDACDQAECKVTAQSLVRYKTNDYSVPVAYGHQDVWVRGYVDEVVIGCRGEIIARHPRSWEREDVIFDPVHYLPLIEQKINSLDQAAPLQGWDLPEEFATLRRLMEGRMAKHGRREYVQVLRLLESFDLADLHAAVKQALQLGAIGFDAVKHLILCRVERRPPTTGPVDLSLPAEGDGRDDIGESLHAPSVLGCGRSGMSTEAPEILLAHYLKTLKLPTFQREYQKLARLCATEGVDHVGYLFRLSEREMIERDRRKVERRIKAARFPVVKSLDSFDFAAIPKLNKMQVLELARCEWIERRENVIALGPSGTGKTHVALGLGSGRMPEGPVRRLHHGRRPGQRDDGGA